MQQVFLLQGSIYLLLAAKLFFVIWSQTINTLLFVSVIMSNCPFWNSEDDIRRTFCEFQDIMILNKIFLTSDLKKKFTPLTPQIKFCFSWEKKQATKRVCISANYTMCGYIPECRFSSCSSWSSCMHNYSKLLGVKGQAFTITFFILVMQWEALFMLKMCLMSQEL